MEIYEFSFIPPTNKWLDQLAAAAIRENWGPNNSYLKQYCEANFELAKSQGLVYEDKRQRFAVWRIGHLVTNDGSPIFGYFVRNNLEGKQPYVLVTILWGHSLVVKYRAERNGHEERIAIHALPKEPRYVIPDYHPEYRIEYNWEHYLAEHRQRIVQAGLASVIKTDRARYLAIFGATELAHRLFKITAVPQYHRGRFQYLLPLFMTQGDYAGRPDLVAALDDEPDRSAYIVRTLLLPDAAYANARCVATNTSQFRSWLGDESGRETAAGSGPTSASVE